MKESKTFSKLNYLPKGNCTKQVTKGCIVLEGGAFRGIYTNGVLDALMLNNLNMECTIGVSAGAMNGMNYVAGQIGRSARINLRYRRDSRYVGRNAFSNNAGIIGFDFIFEKLQLLEPFNYLRFYDPARRFIAVATDCKTGRPRYFEKGTCPEIIQAIRASASMPYVSRPVPVEGIPCLDGGCSDKIPYKWAMNQGYDKILVVKTRPDSYRKKVNLERSVRMARDFYPEYPQFARIFGRSDEDYNKSCDEIAALEKQGRLFVISPSQPVKVGRLEKNMEKLGELYYMGYYDAQNQMEALKAYLVK